MLVYVVLNYWTHEVEWIDAPQTAGTKIIHVLFIYETAKFVA